jgi:hypothetical protein
VPPLDVPPEELRAAKLRDLAVDYGRTFGSEHGARVLADLERRGFMARTTLCVRDPEGTAFNEGQRMMVLHIRKMTALKEADVRRLAHLETENLMENFDG